MWLEVEKLHQSFMSSPPRSALLPLFWGEGCPTKIDYRTKGTLTLTDLDVQDRGFDQNLNM